MPKKSGYFRPNKENAWLVFNMRRLDKLFYRSFREIPPKFRHKAYRKASQRELSKRSREIRSTAYANWDDL